MSEKTSQQDIAILDISTNGGFLPPQQNQIVILLPAVPIIVNNILHVTLYLNLLTAMNTTII